MDDLRQLETYLIKLRASLREAKEMGDTFCQAVVEYLDSNHATIAARNALEMNDKLARALAYYYSPTDQEMRDFDEHCYEISAAGSCPPDPELYWSELAFNHWKFRHD